MTNEDWLALLKLGGAAAGAAGGMGAFGGAAGAVPTGDTMSGADLGGNLTAGAIQPPQPPPDFGAGIPGQALQPGMEQGGIGSDMERAGVLPTQGPPLPPSAAPAPKPNLGLPTQTPLTPSAVDATTAASPPPPGAAGATPYPFKYADKPIGTENTRTWWERNVSDPWDKANQVDPKTGLSPAQKALAGLGQSAGGLAGKASASASSSPAAPAGSVYKPTPINAAQMALTREQQLELLRKRSRTSMPWLNRLQGQQGLMG